MFYQGGDGTVTIAGSAATLAGPLTITSSITDWNGHGGNVVKIIGGADGTAINGIQNNTNITSLTLPDGLTTIGAYSFYGCPGLTGTIAIPSTVTLINAVASYGCGFTGDLGLSGLVIPSMGTNAFAHRSQLTGTLPLPTSPVFTPIGQGAFGYCAFTGELVRPQSVTDISPYAFEYCQFSNENLPIPAPVTSIGAYAFLQCTKLTGNLDLSNLTSLTAIGDCAFRYCPGLDGELALPPSLESIGRLSPSRRDFTNMNLVTPSSVATIGTQASQSNHPIRAVTFEPQALDIATWGGSVSNSCYPPRARGHVSLHNKNGHSCHLTLHGRRLHNWHGKH